MRTEVPFVRLWQAGQDFVARPFADRPMPPARRLIILLLNVLVFALFSFTLIMANEDHILFTGDMFHIFSNAVKQTENGAMFGLTMNLLVYGNIDFGVNARLMPAFIIGSLVAEQHVPSAVFTALSVELFLAVFLSVWLFRLST